MAIPRSICPSAQALKIWAFVHTVDKAFTTDDVASSTGVKHGTIRGHLRGWRDAGILQEQKGYNGSRYRLLDSWDTTPEAQNLQAAYYFE